MTTKSPHLWCLLNTQTGMRADGLLFDEARAYVMPINVTEKAKWLVWRSDWIEWRPLDQVEGLSEPISRLQLVQPPPPPAQQSDTGSDFSLSLSFADSQPKSASSVNLAEKEESQNDYYVRAKRRFTKQMSIIIVGDNGEFFKTYTKDISVGGMYVQDNLPEWVSGYFKVRIAKVSGKQQVELRCHLVENQKPGERFRIAILPLESIEDEKNLEMWLAA